MWQQQSLTSWSIQISADVPFPKTHVPTLLVLAGVWHHEMEVDIRDARVRLKEA
jgi:hypothetical protein